MKRYIIRLDDACPTMDRKKWDAIEKILDEHDIKPIVAVIPNNEDPEIKIDEYDDAFWNKINNWQDKGWHIAMHGYNHFYVSRESGLIPINKQSEFAGIHVETQREKIRAGGRILNDKKIKPQIWVAPSHTFDENTLKVLKEETGIMVISDGLAFYPYSEKGFFWLPQQLWRLKKKFFGIWTVCFHPNVMNFNEIKNMEKFLNRYKNDFINDIDELYKQYKNRQRNIFDRILYQYFVIKVFFRDLIHPQMHTAKIMKGKE